MIMQFIAEFNATLITSVSSAREERKYFFISDCGHISMVITIRYDKPCNSKELLKLIERNCVAPTEVTYTYI